MRIGLLSDTHDQVQRTRAAIQLLMREGAEVFFHCGDICTPMVVHACQGMPGFFVWGNNDHQRGELLCAMERHGHTCLEDGALVELAGVRLAMTHGHVKKTVKNLLTDEPDFLFVGHSHRCQDDVVGATRVINPGALHRARTWTVAVLDLQSRALVRLVLGADGRG